jgi:3D-(3,5/4)-trihydroxycyclohexane-1,2-dione acylhydrolase (decyclizing)
VTVNAARFDAVKHAAHAVVGDARESLVELSGSLAGWVAPDTWAAKAADEKSGWDTHVDELRRGVAPDGALTYAQVVGLVNDASGPDDYVLTASGGMPGELHGGWRTGEVRSDAPTSGATMDLEYGFSCMGYEVVAPWGAAMARAQTHPDGIVTALFGDGSYLMLNSELYSAAFAGHPYVAILCDNGGFAVIHRLQTNQGADGFNNMLRDSRGHGADGSVHVDFAAHARALGCSVEDVAADAGVDELRAAYDRARKTAKQTGRPVVVLCRTHPETWTEAGAWWEAGVPESLSGRAAYEEGKERQLRWL